LVTDGTALNKEYAKSTDAVESAKSAFDKACKEAELAQLAHKVKKKNCLCLSWFCLFVLIVCLIVCYVFTLLGIEN
jgi:hypothetical protein